MSELKREVLLVRHGESETNSTDVYQAGDQMEIDPLDQTGEAQGGRLAQEFKRHHYVPDVIISSGYLRALQTARFIGRVTAANIIVPMCDEAGNITDVPDGQLATATGKSLFRELDLPSELEGRPYGDPVALAIKDEIERHRYDPDWHYSDEENRADIWARAGRARRYLEQRPEQKITVVTHGGFMKAVLAHILFDDAEEDSTWTLPYQLRAYHKLHKAWVDNTGILSLFYEPASASWQPILANNAHLGSTFGFMNNEPRGGADTSADQLQRDAE